MALPEDLKSHFSFVGALTSVQDSSESELVWFETSPDHVLDQANSLPKLHQHHNDDPGDREHLGMTAWLQQCQDALKLTADMTVQA